MLVNHLLYYVEMVILYGNGLTKQKYTKCLMICSVKIPCHIKQNLITWNNAELFIILWYG